MSNPPPEQPRKIRRGPRIAARFRLGSRLGVFRFSAVTLLGSLVILIFASPILERLENGDFIETVMVTIVLVCSVLAVGGKRRNVIGLSLFALPVLCSKWLNQFRPDLAPSWWFYSGALLFCGWIIWRLLRFVLHSAKVDNEVLSASVAAYLLIGLVWSFGYMLIADANPQAFKFSVSNELKPELMNAHNAYYFSFVTLCTVGYGDIVPMSSGARTLAMGEAVTGLLYVAILIARLVALQTTDMARESVRHPDNDKT